MFPISPRYRWIQDQRERIIDKEVSKECGIMTHGPNYLHAITDLPYSSS